MNKDDKNGRNNEYTVGYRKPPMSTQFSRGVSGNPKGRPRGAKNFASILKAVGRQKVKVTFQGRERVMTRDEIAIMHLHNKADSGDLGAIKVFLTSKRLFAEPEEAEILSKDSREKDEAVMRNLLKRLGLPSEMEKKG